MKNSADPDQTAPKGKKLPSICLHHLFMPFKYQNKYLWLLVHSSLFHDYSRERVTFHLPVG